MCRSSTSLWLRRRHAGFSKALCVLLQVSELHLLQVQRRRDVQVATPRCGCDADTQVISNLTVVRCTSHEAFKRQSDVQTCRLTVAAARDEYRQVLSLPWQMKNVAIQIHANELLMYIAAGQAFLSDQVRPKSAPSGGRPP